MASADLTRLLTDLSIRIPEIEQVVALSRDGLTVASAASTGAGDVERLAAIAARALSLGRAAAEYADGDQVRQVLLDVAGKYLFITASGQDGCLAAVTSGGADTELVAREIALLAGRMVDLLPAASKQLSTGGRLIDRREAYQGPLLVTPTANPPAEIRK
jgi:uncharacterized protein